VNGAAVHGGATLGHWLRLLWGHSPELDLSSSSTYLEGGRIHLPPQIHWHGHRAAAAHAAAHLVYSPVRFDGTGLAPIARALMGLLEDARVEALARRELPGLGRLWQPLHQATPQDGTDFESLMRRLARALADPAYEDPHAWIRKGRVLFYLDPAQELLALRTPAELRTAALRLGHDIGQMRLGFNGKLYRPQPSYRDDHRWMWGADNLELGSPPPDMADDASADPPTEITTVQAAPHPEGTVSLYPEWDRLIQRLRRDWCTVTDWPAEELPAGTTATAPDAQTARLASQVRRLLRRALQPTGGLVLHGDAQDLDAAVQWQVAHRAGRSGDPRVYRGLSRRASRATVLLLVDRSASTAQPLRVGGPSVLQAAGASAHATALALRALGVDCSVLAFSSNGRHRVSVHTLQHLAPGADGLLAQRLQDLRSEGSTRLGAALRHATARLARRPGLRWIWLLSDGQPHDIDLHDPRYGVEDARKAVGEGRMAGVRMACLALASDPDGSARRIFGARGTQRVDALASLPRAIHRLLA
jgi:Mg-chelatase subunit ChlD